jgi:hypothetical protein
MAADESRSGKWETKIIDNGRGAQFSLLLFKFSSLQTRVVPGMSLNGFHKRMLVAQGTLRINAIGRYEYFVECRCWQTFSASKRGGV